MSPAPGGAKAFIYRVFSPVKRLTGMSIDPILMDYAGSFVGRKSLPSLSSRTLF